MIFEGTKKSIFFGLELTRAGIVTTDTRKKASMLQVLADIKPYITKKFMAAPCIKEQDIQAICQILLPRYKNVQLIAKGVFVPISSLPQREPMKGVQTA